MNEVDVKYLAELWNVDVRTVQNYADPKFTENPLPKIRRGVYDFVVAVKWMYERQKKEIAILKASGSETLHQMRIEIAQIKKKSDEVALKTKLGKLVSRRAVVLAFSNQINVIDSTITALENDLLRELELTADKKQKIKEEFARTKNLISSLEIKKYITNEEALVEDEDANEG